MIGFLIPGWLKRAAAWAVGLALALFAAWGMGKREGRIGARQKSQEKDARNARKIEDAADAARRRAHADDSPRDERLRRLGGLRDD